MRATISLLFRRLAGGLVCGVGRICEGEPGAERFPVEHLDCIHYVEAPHQHTVEARCRAKWSPQEHPTWGEYRLD